MPSVELPLERTNLAEAAATCRLGFSAREIALKRLVNHFELIHVYFMYWWWLRVRFSSFLFTVQCKSMRIAIVFWKKMFVNNDTILYSLFRLIRDRFAAVASKYGTLSLAQCQQY